MADPGLKRVSGSQRLQLLTGTLAMCCQPERLDAQSAIMFPPGRRALTYCDWKNGAVARTRYQWKSENIPPLFSAAFLTL